MDTPAWTKVPSTWRELVHELRHQVLQETSPEALRTMRDAFQALAGLAGAQRDLFSSAGLQGEKGGKK